MKKSHKWGIEKVLFAVCPKCKETTEYRRPREEPRVGDTITCELCGDKFELGEL